MKTVAITGCIGSGKSTVLRFFKSAGFPCIDCDAIVAGLYKTKPVKKRLSKLFGTASKKRMLSIMLSSGKKRRLLEKTLHPLVWKALQKKLCLLKRQGKRHGKRSAFRAKPLAKGKRLAFVEVPLLFEAKWQKRFDAIIFVRASKKKCMQRLAKKGFSRGFFPEAFSRRKKALAKKQALLLWKAQLSPKKKIKSSHYLINNNGGLASARAQAREIAGLLKNG